MKDKDGHGKIPICHGKQNSYVMRKKIMEAIQ